MSHRLISHSPDLKRLRDEGYEIEVKSAHLLVHSVPYVNSRREIALGTLVTPLDNLAGDRTTRPQTHVIYFAGEHPCDKEGNIIKGIQHSSGRITLAEGVEVDHSFSNKPSNGYADYYEKVTTYIGIIASQAQAINRAVTAKTFKVIDPTDPDIVFNYLDTNSSRAEIEAISAKLQNLKVAIIGLGGTGSYVLDFVAKTPVKEIHLFDEDKFLSHNAFRAPGAASIDTLRKQPKKVAYLHDLYSKMHKHIFPHEYHLTSSVLGELSGMNFVFICIDDGEAKKLIIEKLIGAAIPFVDVGIGINVVDGLLTGSARVTASTSKKNDHINKRISFIDGGVDDYNKNIQIAEINALNAALAVIKWKKLFGFYHDLDKEHHTVYEINTNKLVNDEAVP
ncbi:ThiF family protein [uncultured archaeon]|nr:ThiF family protein [uncultured archaeon]